MASEETVDNVVLKTTSGTAADITALPTVLPMAYSFTPRNLTEAIDLADRLAASDMVPKAFQGKPGNILVAMQWGAEIGLKSLQALQNIAVINGKPGLYGDAGKALLHGAGCRIDERDVAEIRELGVAQCTIQRSGRVPVTRTFSIEDAKTAGLWGRDGPWKTYPYRQMAWRAFWFAARDAAADVLRGLGGVEELRDIPPETERDITPETTVEVGKSKSAKLAESLRKVTLEEVVQAFGIAEPDTMEAALTLAKRLTEPDDKLKANDAYKHALARLRGKAAGGPTFSEVRAMLSKARDAGSVDEAQVALSLIEKIDGDQDLKDALMADAKGIVAKLGEAK